MKKLIRLGKLQCWTLLFILVSYQVNVYSLGRQQIFEDLQTLRKVRNYANLYNNILKLYTPKIRITLHSPAKGSNFTFALPQP